MPGNDEAPVNMPYQAWSTNNGIRKFDDIAATGATGDIGTVLPDYVVKKLRRAYYATVSYIDTLVGRIYNELESLNLLDNTIISYISLQLT